MTLAAMAPGAIISLVLLWTGDFTPKVQWTLTVLIVTVGLGCAFAVRERVVLPLQTLSNLLAALGEGDFSIRARGGSRNDPLGEVLIEVNALVETLRDQRLGAVEASALLRKVMAEIDVAVFTFDEHQVLQLVNRAGERLLAQPMERLLGRTSEELALAECMAVTDAAQRVVAMTFPGGTGRWEIRRSVFRQGGLPHQMLVLTDVSQPLREEERQAWQRLIRVIGHELNNSLAPIKSIAGSLESLLTREPPPSDWRDDAKRGLGVIASRSESLSRFMGAYARLAKLPPPRLGRVVVNDIVCRVAGLDVRSRVNVMAGPALTIKADTDQLEQLLINLLRNAIDATIEAGSGPVRMGWSRLPGPPGQVEIWIEDEGVGLANTSNLFVPFFTTKPGGTGIGLVLSRQIAEAHGGSIALSNREGVRGCRAVLRLPL